MSFVEWLRSFRHPLVVFSAATLVPGIILGWLGWRLLREDQALESRRIQARLEGAAEGVAAALARDLAELEERLNLLATTAGKEAETSAPRLAEEMGEDALVVLIDGAGVEAYPGGRLLYYPSLPPRREPDEEAFAAGEAIELQRNDPAGAIVVFRDLARSRDPGVRAGALLRLARSLRKAGYPEGALASYAELRDLGTTTLGGTPAELLARQARCRLLGDMGRVTEMRQEARALYSDLQNGRWRLTRTAYKFHSDEARQRFEPDREFEAGQAQRQGRLALAEGVESLWDEWQRLRRGEGDPSGRGGSMLAGRFVSLIWRSQTERMAGLVAGPDFLARHVLERVRPLAQRQGVSVALAGTNGHAIGATAGDLGSPRVMRNPAETRLPWTLLVASLDPVADVSEIAGRRRILLASFALMLLVVLAGSYFLARALTRELEAARLKADFVAAVSHEFRTPLASMCQMAELLADDRVPDEEQRRQYYGLQLRETRRLKRLVENLLDFARIEGGAREYRLEPVDVTALVEDVTSEFREEVAPRGHRVELSIKDRGMILQADAEALHRALWNLLDNAVKYSPGCDTAWVHVAREGNQCAILVRDQGLGISAAEQKHIFEKFTRSASARAAGVEGTGIGLSMVDRIVKAHKGRIRVESEPGRGSTFVVLLPLEG